MTRSKRVWAIYYTVRVSSNAPWGKEWTGPCGVGVVAKDMLDSFLWSCLSHRPFFFRTRALARQKIKELAQKKNINWTWVKYTVRPITLSWTEGD